MRNKWYKCKLLQINSKNVNFKTSLGAKKIWRILDLKPIECKGSITFNGETKYFHDFKFKCMTIDGKFYKSFDAEQVVILAKPVEVKAVQYAGKKYKFYFPIIGG